MQQDSVSSLNRIMRGAVIATLGLFAGLIFQFGARLIIARFTTEADYGIFSLALAILNLGVVLAGLGFQEAIPRYIAHFIIREETGDAKLCINSSTWLTALSSVIIGIVLFIFSGIIAKSLFNMPELEAPLQLFAIGLPFLSLINILTAVFRGTGNIGPHAFFQLFLINFIFIALLIPITIFKLPFIFIFFAYIASLLATFIGLLTYFIRKVPGLNLNSSIKENLKFSGYMLRFSMPLMGTVLLTMMITWADTMFIGYYKSPEAVGLYNAAAPIAQFIYHPLSAWQLIYIPVATSLYSMGKIEELKRNYVIVTKWAVSTTMPIFLVVCFFPEAVINIFFGAAYSSAAMAMRILSIGFIINGVFGLRGVTLVAIGESRFIFLSNLVAAVVGIALNVVLIPVLGILGAALATAAALIVSSLLMAIRVYNACGAQPFSKNMVKPIIVSVLLTLILKYFAGSLAFMNWWLLIFLLVLYFGVYGLTVLLTRSFDREDIELLLDIEKISGVNTGLVKKILKRFM